MRMSPAVGVTVSTACVSVEQAKPKQVDQKTRSSNTNDNFRALYFMWFSKSLDCLQDDSKAESCKKYSVNQSPHHLRTDPSKGIFICCLSFFSKTHCH